MKFFQRITDALFLRNRYKTLHYLQGMSNEQLIDCGFSPALIRAGVHAWPWREDQRHDVLSAIKRNITNEGRWVEELGAYSDRELADLGLARGSIREAVRYGRPGIDSSSFQEAA